MAPPFLPLRKLALTLALLAGAFQFAGSVPVRAESWSNGGGDTGEHHEYGADHDEVYQVQRGDLVCNSRQACGGAAAIPMNRPGWFYMPRGFYAADPPPVAPTHRHHRK
jgi:hypothetical protein